jgi:hypothetical protein
MFIRAGLPACLTSSSGMRPGSQGHAQPVRSAAGAGRGRAHVRGRVHVHPRDQLRRVQGAAAHTGRALTAALCVAPCSAGCCFGASPGTRRGGAPRPRPDRGAPRRAVSDGAPLGSLGRGRMRVQPLECTLAGLGGATRVVGVQSGKSVPDCLTARACVRSEGCQRWPAARTANACQHG